MYTAPENIASIANSSPDDWISQWLVNQLQLSLARSDLAVIAQAIPPWRTAQSSRITQLTEWFLQTCEISEFRV